MVHGDDAALGAELRPGERLGPRQHLRRRYGDATGTSNGVGFTMLDTWFSAASGTTTAGNWQGWDDPVYGTPARDQDMAHVTAWGFTLVFDEPVCDVIFYLREDGGNATLDLGLTPEVVSGGANLTVAGTRVTPNTDGGAVRYRVDGTTVTHTDVVAGFDGMDLAFFVETLPVDGSCEPVSGADDLYHVAPNPYDGTATLDVHETTTELSLEWPVPACTIAVYDDAAALVDATLRFSGAAYIGASTCEAVRFPTTDDAGIAPIWGAYAPGYPLEVEVAAVGTYSGLFELLADGTWSPASFDIAGHTYVLRCDAADTCEPDVIDLDLDGVPDDVDNCLVESNPDQADGDGDLVGDACDPCPIDATNDSDGDGVCDSTDLCPGADDDLDDDLDGVPDGCDRCWGGDDLADLDGDGIADACDPCPEDLANDSDGDGVCGNEDHCPGSNDLADGDGDGAPDGCDPCPLDAPDDTDLDGVCDTDDWCPLDAPDDPDLDGVCTADDLCPTGDDAVDTDLDATADACDACPLDAANDADGDGVCESVDNCPTVPNTNQSNLDQDAYGDACEPDIDGDGIIDDLDNCRYTRNPAQVDSDHDGSGDDCDFDNDNDGVPDGYDACPGTPSGTPVIRGGSVQTGCGFEQVCPCPGSYKKGSEKSYLGCIQGVRHDLVASGALSAQEAQDLLKTYKDGPCGKK